MKNLLQAGDALCVRLRVLQKLQMQFRERDTTHVFFHVEELFEQKDLEALENWDQEKARATGQIPLPMGGE